MSATSPQERAGPQAFVERFAATWRDPTPERLNALLHPDVRLVQPLEGELRGRAAALAMWRRVFALMPDLRAELISSTIRDDDVLWLELRMHATLSGRPVEWFLVDRVRLRDGLVDERIAYFDSLELIRKAARAPRSLGRWLAAHVRQRAR